MKPFIRNRYLFVIDGALCVGAYALTAAFLFPLAQLDEHLKAGAGLIAVTVLTYLLVLTAFGVYRADWVFAGAKEYLRLLGGCVLSGGIVVGIGMYLSGDMLFPKFNIAANLGVMALICAARFLVRMLYKLLLSASGGNGKRTLIIGAGRLAIMLMRDITENRKLDNYVVGLIDDDPAKQKTLIYGSKVIGTREDIVRLCGELGVEEIIFAIHMIPPAQKKALIEICSETDCNLKILPGVAATLNGDLQAGAVRRVEIEDLLERDPVQLDNSMIQKDIRGKTVLVTGGSGSIGSELCRQIIKYSPKRLIILDIYENTSYELENELKEQYPDQEIDVLIASVRDRERLDAIFETYRPDIVFHAAAHKHVPLMETSPCEAIKNNVFGTLNTAACAREYGVKRFVLISTDKAVNPTNVMGASKRMCEMIVQTMQKSGNTEFAAVRFGNVLGSNGSVIPRFRKQIAKGGPVTVTHPEITRFFMTIPEAAQLVLQAAAYAKGGEIFVLDMGEPVRIYDLAKKMIKLSGLKLGENIEIVFTGLRPGEKLYEELLMSEEGLRKTAHSKIFVGQPIDINAQELREKLDKLKEALPEDGETVKQILSQVVPTYQYQPKKDDKKEGDRVLSAV